MEVSPWARPCNSQDQHCNESEDDPERVAHGGGLSPPPVWPPSRDPLLGLQASSRAWQEEATFLKVKPAVPTGGGGAAKSSHIPDQLLLISVLPSLFPLKDHFPGAQEGPPAAPPTGRDALKNAG